MTLAIAALTILIVALLIAHERERQQWHRERSELLNRIKPETAQHAERWAPFPAPEPSFDTDKDYWKARGVEVEQ